MKEKIGNFLVSFGPGEVIGKHHEREAVLRNICTRLGGFDCKVFDSYLVYSGLADAGYLIRVEGKCSPRFWSVSFFYPGEAEENKIRRKIINVLLDEAKSDPKLPLNGYAVVSDKSGNLKLGCLKKRRKNVFKRTQTKIFTKGLQE